MTQPARRQPFALSVLLGAILLSGQAMASVSDEDILQDPKNPGQIVTNGLGVQGQRYSPLDTLNVDNVKDLRPVWAFSFGGEKQRGQQAQPMIKDGVMYLTGSYSRVFAVDARTGKKLWQYDARLPDDIRPCCDVINRGVALYGDLVFFGTLDAKLVALNKDRQSGVEQAGRRPQGRLLDQRRAPGGQRQADHRRGRWRIRRGRQDPGL